QSYQLQNEQLQNEIEQFTILYREEQLQQFMKHGATINGNYILNYTNEISNDIKNQFRSLTQQLWKTFETVIKEKNDLTSKQLQDQLDELQVNESVISERNDIDSQYEQHISNVQEKLNHVEDEVDTKPLQDIMEARKVVEKAASILTIDKEDEIATDEWAEKDKHTASEGNTVDTDTMTGFIDKVLAT